MSGHKAFALDPDNVGGCFMDDIAAGNEAAAAADGAVRAASF